jgi:chromosome partitioning protein
MQQMLPLPRFDGWFAASGALCTSPSPHETSAVPPIGETGLVHDAPALQGRGDPKMKTVAFVNKKGGVGKSSCVMHLGGVLAKKGLRTLVVDCDPQASLSQGLLGPQSALALHPFRTLAALYDDECPGNIRDLVMGIGRSSLALIAGHDKMTDFNVPRPWRTGADQFILRDALADLGDDFDICLLDCPPHIQACAWSALVAADGAVIPAQCEDFGIQGVSMIQDSIDHARSTANSRLVLLGFLPTMFVKTLKIHIDYAADLRSLYGPDVFEAVVPAAKDFKEAVTLQKTITEHKPRSAAALAIEAVAGELLTRIDARCGLVHRAPSTPVIERIGA